MTAAEGSAYAAPAQSRPHAPHPFSRLFPRSFPCPPSLHPFPLLRTCAPAHTAMRTRCHMNTPPRSSCKRAAIRTRRRAPRGGTFFTRKSRAAEKLRRAALTNTAAPPLFFPRRRCPLFSPASLIFYTGRRRKAPARCRGRRGSSPSAAHRRPHQRFPAPAFAHGKGAQAPPR